MLLKAFKRPSSDIQIALGHLAALTLWFITPWRTELISNTWKLCFPSQPCNKHLWVEAKPSTAEGRKDGWSLRNGVNTLPSADSDVRCRLTSPQEPWACDLILRTASSVQIWATLNILWGKSQRQIEEQELFSSDVLPVWAEPVSDLDLLFICSFKIRPPS